MVSTNGAVIYNNIYRNVLMMVLLFFNYRLMLPQAQRATAFHYKKVVDLSTTYEKKKN